jgi:peroxiredoxin
MRAKRLFVSAILTSCLVFGTCLLAGCGQGSGLSAAPAVPFVPLNGQKLTPQSLQGKVVLVNFWATSCVTCVKEMPMLVDTFNKYAPKGYDTVAVAMSYDPPNYVLNFVETRKLPFTVSLDPQGEIAKAWNNTKVTPTSYLIDKKGQIVKRYVGEPNVAEFHATIEKLLAQNS